MLMGALAKTMGREERHCMVEEIKRDRDNKRRGKAEK